MQISSRVFLAASGFLGCSLSHSSDCNAYAVRVQMAGTEGVNVPQTDRYIVIDTGTGVEPDLLLSRLAADGISPGQIHLILLTHGHLDHSGGTHALHSATGAPVWTSELTASVLTRGDEDAISLTAAKRAGIYGPEFRFQACPVARVLRDGETIPLGDSMLHVIYTPGHSRDMASYLFDTPDGTLLFPGDTVFHSGRVLLSSNWDCNPKAYGQSLRTLAARRVDGLYPGHGIWSVTGAMRHLELSVSYLDRTLLPPNLL